MEASDDGHVQDITWKLEKISHDGKKTSVVAGRTIGEGEERVTIETDQDPTPEFKAAFKALSEDVLALCEIPASKKHHVDVRHVQYRYGSEGMGVTLTGVREVVDGPGAVTLNTPYRRENTWSDAFQSRLTQLDLEVQGFMKGKRSQLGLFPTSDQGDGAADQVDDAALLATE